MSFKPNRRSFLIASGLTALASTKVLGANDTVRVGVIGAGHVPPTERHCYLHGVAHYACVLRLCRRFQGLERIQRVLGNEGERQDRGCYRSLCKTDVGDLCGVERLFMVTRVEIL